MPATVEFGEPPPEPSLRNMYESVAALHPPINDNANGNEQRDA